MFHALVDNEGVEVEVKTAAGDSKSGKTGKSLLFDLGGSGTLPCIAFDQPSELTAEGSLLIDFGRLLVDRSSRRKLVVRNDGVMPATCLFDLEGNETGAFMFPAKGTSLTVNPAQKEEVWVSFSPKQPPAAGDDGARKATVKVSVLNNQFDAYRIDLTGTAYACDAAIDTSVGLDFTGADDVDYDFDPATSSASAAAGAEDAEEQGGSLSDLVTFKDINLANGPGENTYTVQLKSTSTQPLRFNLAVGEDVPKVLKFSPSAGHLAPGGTREVTITFAAEAPIKLENAPVHVSLQRIRYPDPPAEEREEGGGEEANAEAAEAAAKFEAERALWGVWDDSMKSVRPALPEDVERIKAARKELEEYEAKAAAEKAKGKKGKPVGPPPEKCLLELGPVGRMGSRWCTRSWPSPRTHLLPPARRRMRSLPNPSRWISSAMVWRTRPGYSCEGEGQNLTFVPTFLFQSTVHTFSFKNESNVKMPIKWDFDNLKARRGLSSRAQSRPGLSHGWHATGAGTALHRLRSPVPSSSNRRSA